MRDYIKLCNSDQLFSSRVVLVGEYSPGINEWESQCADSINAHTYIWGLFNNNKNCTRTPGDQFLDSKIRI